MPPLLNAGLIAIACVVAADCRREIALGIRAAGSSRERAGLPTAGSAPVATL